MVDIGAPTCVACTHVLSHMHAGMDCGCRHCMGLRMRLQVLMTNTQFGCQYQLARCSSTEPCLYMCCMLCESCVQPTTLVESCHCCAPMVQPNIGALSGLCRSFTYGRFCACYVHAQCQGKLDQDASWLHNGACMSTCSPSALI